MQSGTQVIRLSIVTLNDKDWSAVHQGVCDLARAAKTISSSVNVSFTTVPEDDDVLDEEFHDEDTLFKVYDALRRTGLDEQQARHAIMEMQNVGILFRERRSRP